LFPTNKYIEFTGTIAGQPALVQLTDTEDGMKGRYKYLKYGKIILLQGVIDRQHQSSIELSEGRDGEEMRTPLWRANYTNGEIVGKWYNANRTKTYSIQLAKKNLRG